MMQDSKKSVENRNTERERQNGEESKTHKYEINLKQHLTIRNVNKNPNLAKDLRF